jgi:hypothetical protein
MHVIHRKPPCMREICRQNTHTQTHTHTHTHKRLKETTRYAEHTSRCCTRSKKNISFAGNYPVCRTYEQIFHSLKNGYIPVSGPGCLQTSGMHTHTHTHTHTHKHTHVYTYIYIYMYIYIRVHTHIHICMYIIHMYINHSRSLGMGNFKGMFQPLNFA